MGLIKIKRERFFPENSKVKSIRIKKENGNYFAVFALEFDEKEVRSEEFLENNEYENSLGMDTNNGHLDFSNGDKLNWKKSLTKSELEKLKNKESKKLLKELNKLEKLQLKQSKREEEALKSKKKLGKNYHKTRKQMNKIRTTINNRKKHALHGISKEILSKAFSVLFLEDLDVKSMTKKSNDKKTNSFMSSEKIKQMRKNILSFSYSSLHNILAYKAQHLGRLVIFVDPRYTSKQCSFCDSILDISLKDRWFSCSCGLSIDRDINSAINIRNRGISFFSALNSDCLASLKSKSKSLLTS